MKPSLAQCLSMLCLLALPAIAAAPPGDRALTVRRAAVPAESPERARVIVKFRADGGLMRESALAVTSGREPRVQHAARLSQRVGLALTDGHEVMPRTQVLHARGLRSSELVVRLQADPDVEMAWVDERVRATAAPNDPRYAGGQVLPVTPAAGQWYLRAPDATTLVSAINAEGAWDVSVGSPSVVVAVLDTGVRRDHPDFVGKLLPGYDFVSEDTPGDFSTANDGNGRDADASDPGDWVTAAENAQIGGPFENCGETSSSWHGTQTAGLVGAATNNGIGMASVGRNVRVLPVRVLGKCGGFASDVVAGMRWAAGLSNDPVVNPTPAKVVNMSLGSTGSCSGAAGSVGALYQSAVTELVTAGVVVVVAAGNDAGQAVGRPANCAGAIGVGGLRNVGTKVGFSDVGPEISISAPGGNCVNPNGTCLFPLLTTTNSGSTGPANNTFSSGGADASLGTSFSSPLVAGTAALMRSINPALTPAQVRSLLQSNARAFPTTGGTAGTPTCVAPNNQDQLECYCTTSTCGAGMLNASAAVAQAAATRATTALVFATPANPSAGATVVLDGSSSIAAAGRTLIGYQWTLVGATAIATLSAPTDAATVSVVTNGSGTFTARLTITDSTQASASTDFAVAVAAPAPVSSGDGGGGALSLLWLLGLAAAVMRLARRP